MHPSFSIFNSQFSIFNYLSMKTINIKPITLILCILVFTGCEIDDRVDDLTGGYKGAFIDKNTGDTICTEYYGAKIKLLDMEYGSYAQPLEYKALPDGTFQNTKIYPSKYKIWADGPFISLDTIYGDIRKFTTMDLMAIPNMSLKIEKVEIRLGIIADITFSYSVNDIGSQSQEIGIVYSTNKFPGQINAVPEGNSGSTFKRIKTVSELQGTFTESFNLETNTSYYFRALGRTSSAGDYWNYSRQVGIKTGNIDLSDIPVEPKTGASSASSAIIQWIFPSVVDKVKISYTDRDGLEISDIFSVNAYSYAANLPLNQSSDIKINLISEDQTGPDKFIRIKTKSLAEQYIPQANQRPANIPFFYDLNMKYSISRAHANIMGPKTGNFDWVNNSMNHEFLDWWDTWLNAPQYLPTCENMEDFTDLEISGGIKSLIDLLPCIKLERLTITQGSQFSPGEVISKDVDLSVLKKLKKLNTITLGANIPLTEEMFRKAGVTIDIVKK